MELRRYTQMFNINSGYGAVAAHGGLMGPGKTFYVVNAADSAVANYLLQIFPPDPDGVDRVYVATSATADTAIQAALDACLANRNDYVVVMPSGTNYSITVTLQMTKKGVHLICPTGMSNSGFPIGNTARLKSSVAATPVINITAEACEVAGFYIKNYTAVEAITLATTVSGQNIHHNAFMMVWSGSPAPIISGVGAGGAWGSIERNWFISETGTSITSAIAAISILAGATGCRVCHNEVTIGDGNTASVAISNLAVKGHTDFNIFSESGGSGAAPSGGTITKCVAISTMGCAIENRGAVATSGLLTGGTTGHSFVGNLAGTVTAGTDHWNPEA